MRMNSDRSSSDEDRIVADDHHVLRYVGGSHIDQGIIGGGGFLRKPTEDYPSVNWLECFAAPLGNQVEEVRSRKRISYKKTARLARLNVGRTRSHVSENSPDKLELSFVKDPLVAEPPKFELDDPSHALMEGPPTVDTPEGEMIGDLIAQTIIDDFPALPDLGRSSLSLTGAGHRAVGESG
jgi:hypothetical protein